MVTISAKEQARKFLGIIDSKSPGFFRTVKTLCLAYSVTAAQACDILSACTKVEFLACWVDCEDHPELPLLVSRLPLRRLSVEFKHFSKILPVWSTVLTHLNLVVWETPLPPGGLSRLSQLPGLTHVAFSFGTPGLDPAVICETCASLQVLVILHESLFSPEDRDYLFDSRIVVQDEPENLLRDWEACYFGHPDLWSHAEDVIEQRKAAAVSGADYRSVDDRASGSM